MPPSRLRPRKTPVQARALETRSLILDAAARVFSVHGYAAGTTNRIAAEAGLSIGSLYQYFPNKDAILVTLVRAHVTEGTEAVLAAVEQARHLPAEDLTGRVRAIVDAVVGVHAGDPGLHQVLFEEAPRPPELLDELRALEDGAVRVAADLIAARPPADLTHDDEMTARMVVTTIESLVHRLVATRQPRVAVDDVRREVTAVVVRYLVGWLAGGDRPEPGQGARRSSNRSVEK
jgi:AcrR family transcriptional regulator